MSNIWSYTTFISPCLSIPDNTIQAVVGAAGYSFRNSETGHIDFERVDPTTLDFEKREFDQLDEALLQAKKAGALFPIWKEDIDLSLNFDITGIGEKWRIKRHKIQDTPTYGVISLSVSNFLLRPSAPKRDQVSQDARTIFSRLCVEFSAKYGFSADENALEYYLGRLPIHDNIRLGHPPAALFWLNYFSYEYVGKIRLDILESLGGHITSLDTGVLVTFFENPVENQLPALVTISQEWQKHLG